MRSLNPRVLAFVYRLGSESLRDWASVFNLPVAKGEGSRPLCARVQGDVLSFAIEDGGVYSAPLALEAAVTMARKGR